MPPRRTGSIPSHWSRKRSRAMAYVYVATFFSHFDAVQFGNRAKQSGLAVKLMPVPRRVSSSCGTGAQFASDGQMDFTGFLTEGVDKIYLQDGQEYVLCYAVDDG